MTRGNRFIVRLPGSSQVIPVEGQLVSGSYFGTLGVSPARGRLLTAGDGRVDQIEPVAVVSDGFWKRSLGAADAAIGQTLVVNGVSVTVVGVTPPGFVGMWTDGGPDLWLPLTLQPALGYQTNSSAYSSADRSQPWVTQDRIAWLNAGRPRSRRPIGCGSTAQLQAANRTGLMELAQTFDDGQGRREMLAHTLAVESFARGFSGLRGQFSTALFALMAMVAVVLLMTCANIANLMLARAARRSRDVAIRISLGATTGRLIRQGLTESVMLASLGGGAGLLAGEWASGFLAHQVLGSSGQLPPAFAPDARVTAFAAAISLVTAILFGLAPAVRATRAGRTAAIATTERHAVGQSTMKGMRPLVTAQLALSVVVVFAAVLLGRTLINFTRIDPGFARRSSRDRQVRCRLQRLFTRPDAGARPAPGRRGEGACPAWPPPRSRRAGS